MGTCGAYALCVCSAGFLTLVCLKGVPGEGILAIDVAPRMLEHARGRFPDVAFVEADFLGPDLNGLIFDVVVMNGEAVSLRQFSPPNTVTCNFGA